MAQAKLLWPNTRFAGSDIYEADPLTCGRICYPQTLQGGHKQAEGFERTCIGHCAFLLWDQTTQRSALTSVRLLVDVQGAHQPPHPCTRHHCRSLSASPPQQLHALYSLVGGERRLGPLGSAQQRCRADPRGALRCELLGPPKPSHSSRDSGMGWLAAFSF